MRLLPDGFDAVDELYTDDQLGQLVVSVEAAPTVLCPLGELEDHGERRLVGEASLGSHGTVSHGGECAFDGVGCPQVLPMLGGKVVERQQRFAILGQACSRLFVFDGVGLDEGVEGVVCVAPGLGHPDVLESTLCLRLLALGQLVQDVRGLVHPTALAARPGPHFLDRLPEAERAVGDREFRPHREPAPLEVEQQLAP